jgi:O-antigen/teichoic acid export membrane protein
MESSPARSLENRTVRAALASGGAEVITRVLAVLLSVATARALEPREVGILGIAVIIIGVISMLGYYPETAAVAARGSRRDEEYAMAASLNRAIIIVPLLILVALSLPLFAGYLAGQDGGVIQLQQLIRILVWVPIFEILAGYPRVLLQRKLELSYLAGIQLVQPVVFVGLAVILLMRGHGYLGVAWANLLGTAVAAAFLWLRLWRRSIKWGSWPEAEVWRETAKGSGRIFLGGFGGFLGERVDNLLVAGMIGPAAMSFYSMAWNAARTPANVFARAINFVLVPTLARIQDEPSRVERALRECIRHSYLLLAPVCAVLFVSAPLLVEFILGGRWLPLVGCLRVMSFTVFAVPVLFTSGALLTAIGRAHLIGIATLIHLVTLAVLIPVLASRWGVIGAAFADLTATAIVTIALLATAKMATRRIKWALASTMVLPVSASIFAGMLAGAIGTRIENDAARLLSELALVLTGYLSFTIAFGGSRRIFDFIAVLRGVFKRQSVAIESHG